MKYTDEDLRLLLESGYEIKFSNQSINMYSISLSELIKFPYSKVNIVISSLILDDEDSKQYLKSDNPTTFKYLYLVFLKNKLITKQDNITLDDDTKDKIADSKNYCDDILKFLKLLFHDEVVFDEKYGFVIGNNYVLNEVNYDEFRKLLKLRLCLSSLDGNDDNNFNPDSAFTKRLLEKRKLLHEKLKKAKEKTNVYEEDEDSNDNNIDLSDLISIFSEAEHMFINDVIEKYDIFQFNNQFNRLKIMDDFHINIRMLMSGAKDIKLKHWLSKITNNKDDNEDD